jgi:hypothetical protein
MHQLLDFQRFANITQTLDFQRFYASQQCGRVGRRAWGSIVKHLLKMLNENAQVLDFQRFGSLSKSLSIL